ncbi:MAG: hypothetical protein JW902_16630 [Syntrophaceae bacterium]|nr:hypothetical protein [Syntrophaceae bacterium]
MDAGTKVVKTMTVDADKTKQKIISDLHKRGCPICNHVSEFIFSFMANFQSKFSSDLLAQKQYAMELGFCAVHTWLLEAMSSPKSLSRGYPKLLERISEELTKMIDTSQNLPHDIGSFLKDLDNCRVCRLVSDVEEMYARNLANFLEGIDLY